MSSEDSPIVAHYKVLKEKYLECILLFQIGEFYEMFDNDAYIVAKLLGLVISYKTKQKVPMCGFPKSSLEIYVHRVMSAGYKVAVCNEKVEDGRVQRDVVRVFTKGTLIEEDMLSQSNNFILSVAGSPAEWTYAVCDVSTGEMYVGTVSLGLENLLMMWDPSECLLDKSVFGTKIWPQIIPWEDRFSFVDLANDANYLARAEDLYGKAILSSFTHNQAVCIGVLIEYITYAQKESIRHLRPPRRNNSSDIVNLDSFTVQNLEIFQTLQGDRAGSIYNLLRNTITGVGNRLLRRRFQEPSVIVDVINDRLDAIEYFIRMNIDLSQILKDFADIDRIIARIGFNRSNLRDLFGAIRSLQVACDLYDLLHEHNISYEVNNAVQCLNCHSDLLKSLLDVFIITEHTSLDQGGFVKRGYDYELDQMISAREKLINNLDLLRERYIVECGISQLQIKYVQSIGFFIEVAKSKATSITYSFKRIQDLTSSIRYTTDELETCSAEIIELNRNISNRERGIFTEFVEAILARRQSLTVISNSIAVIDLSYSMAKLAHENGYTRPEFVQENTLKIVQGRHIGLEKYRRKVVANDCLLTPGHGCMLMTGPNMSGKTTFLKQNAIIVLMAHVGLFVPAQKATMGIVDSIFVRVGAHDNLTKGMSTFMVEMYELAIIMNKSTNRSLVIIDEIGRGTSATEGMAIACAVLERLRDKEIRTIFATHYSNTAAVVTGLQEVQMAIELLPSTKEQSGDEDSGDSYELRFLYKIIPGRSEKSYALLVGKLAGVPKEVLDRATGLLSAGSLSSS